jgi:hypothetical protein
MSKPLLQQLYDGEIFPAEQIVPKHLEYRELCRKLREEKEYFRELLSASDRERFDAMENLSQEIENLYGYEDFSCGFRLGVGLMIEALASGDGLSRDDE